MAKADIPGAEELREIGRRLCLRIGVRLHEPITALALRRLLDERPHTPDTRGVRQALRACADALADCELPPEVHALRAALDAYASVRQSTIAEDKIRTALAAAMNAAIPWLDEEAERRAKACGGILTEEERNAGRTYPIWPSPDSLRHFPRKMLELLKLLDLEAHMVKWLHRIVREVALVDALQDVEPAFASPRVRMAQALYEDGYEPAQITTIIHPFATSKAARKAARLAVAKRLELRPDEAVVEPRRTDNAVDTEASARAGVGFVLTGEAEGLGLRRYLIGPTESVIAEEFPVEERLKPKGPRRTGKATRKKRSPRTMK